MRLDEAKAWLDELVRESNSFRVPPTPADWYTPKFYLDHGDPLAWLARAGSALEAVLPPGHAVLRTWSKAVSSTTAIDNVDRAVSLVRAAQRLANDGRLRTLVDGVRADTVGEVLEQATELARAGHQAAATVLAGGALETHLRHLCDRAGLLSSMTGHGSISKYADLMGQSRKRGDDIISKSDQTQVIGWGQARNDAAHDPTNFAWGRETTQLMLDGIRQFLARNP